jgi:hypothetical protein
MVDYGYTLGLALDDYLTVVFFGIGPYYLGRMASKMDRRAGVFVFAGWILITLGGIFQASWKLIIVLMAKDVRWMNDSQFIWMAPGFILLAVGLLQALKKYRDKDTKPQSVVLPVVSISSALALAGYLNVTMDGRTWFFALLGVATVANVIVSAALVRFSWQENRKLASFLFLLNILFVFIVSGLAAVLGQDLTAQWIKQITNNLSYGAFALAAFIIGRHVSSKTVS